MAPTIAMANELPPLGAMVFLTDPAAPPAHLATVDIHRGRYFYAGGYRFHVADDRTPRQWRLGDPRVWQAGTVVCQLLSPNEGESLALPFAVAPAPASAAAPVTGFSVTEPIGHPEPHELW